MSKIKCPKCGSEDVEVEGMWSIYPNELRQLGSNPIFLRAGTMTFHCISCDNEWVPSEAQVEEYRAILDKIETARLPVEE